MSFSGLSISAFDDAQFAASFSQNFKDSMSTSAGVTTSNVIILSITSASVAVASEVHFDWDDTGVASTFQAALVSNISEIFVVNAGSNGTSSFWTQVGIPETLSASTAQIAASPPPPSPPPDLPSPPPPPAGVVRVDSTVLFGFEDSASTPSSLVLADFIPQYTVSVAAAAGVPAESVTITSFYPAGSPTDSTPKDAGAETYYIYADDETDAALLDAVAAGDLAASTLVITAQVEFPWTSTQEAEQFEQLLVNNTRSVFQQSADGGDDPYWDQFSTVELDDGTEFATEFNAAIIASVATSAGVPLEDVGAVYGASEDGSGVQVNITVRFPWHSTTEAAAFQDALLQPVGATSADDGSSPSNASTGVEAMLASPYLADYPAPQLLGATTNFILTSPPPSPPPHLPPSPPSPPPPLPPSPLPNRHHPHCPARASLGIVRITTVIGFTDLRPERFTSSTFDATFRREFQSAMVAAAGAPGTWCEIDSISSGVVRIASVTHFSWDAYAAALLFREHLDQSTRSIFTGDYWEQFGVGYALEISDTERVDAADIPPPPPAPPPGGVYLLQSTLRFADVEVTEMLPGSALRVEFEANFIAAMGAAAGVPTSDVDVVSISAGSVVVASTVTFLWTQEAEAQAFELTLATSPSDVFPAAGERGGWAEYGEVKTISVSIVAVLAHAPDAPPPIPLLPPPTPPPPCSPNPPNPPSTPALAGESVAGVTGNDDTPLDGVAVGEGAAGTELEVDLASPAPEFATGYPQISKIAGTSFDLTVQLDLPGVVHYLVLPADSPDAAQLVAYSLLGRTAMHGVQLQTGSGSAEWWDVFAQSVAEACGSAKAADVGMVSSNSSETDPTTTIVRYEVRVSRNTADTARSALLEESADGSLLQRLQEHGLGEVIRLETSDVETSEEVQAGAVAVHAGGEGAVKGAVECPDNERSEVVNIEDTASETVHSVFVVAVRHIWQTVGQDAATVMLEVTTLDVTAPSWWSSTSVADDGTEVPRVEAATATSLVVAVALNEPGRVYYAVKEPPSPEHIMAGEVPTSVATGAVEVPKVGTEVMIEVDGLTSETTYTVHLVAEDNRTPPNWQEEPTRLRASTLDITPPQLEVLGTVNIQVVQGATYIDLGARAYDTNDRDISQWVKAESSVDISRIGVYRVTYTVADAAGNEAEPVERIVSVVNAPPPSPYGPAQPPQLPASPQMPSLPPRSPPRGPPPSIPLPPSLPSPPAAPVVATLTLGTARALSGSEAATVAATFAEVGGAGVIGHISYTVYTFTAPAYHAQATSSLDGMRQWDNATRQSFVESVAAVCAVPVPSVQLLATWLDRNTGSATPSDEDNNTNNSLSSGIAEGSSVGPSALLASGEQAPAGAEYRVAAADAAAAARIAAKLHDAGSSTGAGSGRMLAELQSRGQVNCTTVQSAARVISEVDVNFQADRLMPLPVNGK
ncbi:hypothetical protein CYMTET_56115 [Cymbomonas tetramitiformis]|uniref:Pesticidal crystal protein Cry22Aa Ig-like domain-containing protein n=1 Tax=Cymbomonas tetramitiformis TaxID=36881 RepID=A0AAE0BDB6_9CHLO|nr:hypothetical protein CYMTET_56115 [Cymbomonas tetramitiformis]